MRSAVLGPGGVGGLLAAALPGAMVVSRSELPDGLTVHSCVLGELRAQPRVVGVLEEPVDVLFVATKATGLQEAIARVRADPGAVVPLLNGVEHLALLRERFANVVAATIRVEATRVAPGVIEQTSPFLRVELAGEEPVAALLRAAGIDARVIAGEAQVMWSKLTRLAALSLTTTAYGATLGEIRSARRDELLAAVGETAAVATAEGAHVDAAAVRRELLEEAHPQLRTSMARDVEAGRAPELDAIGGAVLRAGARHGIGTPTVARLVETIRSRLP